MNLSKQTEIMGYDYDPVLYWQNRIFNTFAMVIAILGFPVVVYGAYLFYQQEMYVQMMMNLCIYAGIILIIAVKAIRLSAKKNILIFLLYILSLTVFFYTGPHGAGVIFLVLTLVLSSLMLPRNYALMFFLFNYVVLFGLTLFVLSGDLDQYLISEYKDSWLMIFMSVQVAALIPFFLVNAIYDGISTQAEIIKESENKKEELISNISDVIMILDADYIIRYISPNFNKICNSPNDRIINQPFVSILNASERQAIRLKLDTITSDFGSGLNFETKLACCDCPIKPIEVFVKNLINNKNINGLLLNFKDISERKEKEQEVLHMSRYDVLTGLINRSYFEVIKNKVDKREYLPLSVISADIDGLRIINDQEGQDKGDQIIKNISAILNHHLSYTDILARTGGDEFTILLPGKDIDEAYRLIGAVQNSVEEYCRMHYMDASYISVSFGTSVRLSMQEYLEEVIQKAEENIRISKLLQSKSTSSSLISNMKAVLYERSEETEEHGQRLIDLSIEIAKELDLSFYEMDKLVLLAKLHDIGKISIDDRILKKPGPLDAREWEEMKKHPEIGYRIAMASPELSMIAELIYSHHERYDGKGYPRGLKGEEIPLIARILAVVDSFDAMTEDRIYRKGMSHQQAVIEISKCSGTQFDPKIVDIFLNVLRKKNRIIFHKF